MRKEDFFEVLGELDDDVVKGAAAPMRRQINWRVWGAMAACFALVAVLSLAVLQNGLDLISDDDANPPGGNVSINNNPSGGGKLVVNFEGRVSEAEQGMITLENGKIVKITEDTNIFLPDGSAGQIAVGDYIQGYAENPESDEIKAMSILITPL